MKHLRTIIIGTILLFLNACGVKLYEAHLSTAILDETYSYQLAAHNDNWDWFDDNYYLFSQTSGSLPSGVYLTSGGAVVGTPSETGNFIFTVRVHSIDEDIWDDDEYVGTDQKWFTLFVTEKSTNSACPVPNDETTSEIYICLGTIEEESLSLDDEFSLDINYFIDRKLAGEYAVETIDFTVNYNPSLYAIDPDRLTSALLREASTRADSTVTYDNQNGALRVVITAHDNTMDKSGRVMDLPFYALSDIPAGEYDFTVDFNSITSFNDGVSWPNTYEVDGSVTVDNDATDD